MPADGHLLAHLRNQDVNSILPKKQQEVGEPLLSIQQHLQCANHQQWAGCRVPESQLLFASSHTQHYLPAFHCIDDWSLSQVILHALQYSQSLGKVAFSKQKRVFFSGSFSLQHNNILQDAVEGPVSLCPKPFWYHLLSSELHQRVTCVEIIFPSSEVGCACDLALWNSCSCLWSKEMRSRLAPCTPTPKHTWNEDFFFERTTTVFATSCSSNHVKHYKLL